MGYGDIGLPSAIARQKRRVQCACRRYLVLRNRSTVIALPYETTIGYNMEDFKYADAETARRLSRKSSRTISPS